MEFCPNALTYATWIYNQTYHSAIEMTLHQVFTCHRATLDNLLTFGCTVTPKMARDRMSALDPNSHRGIFLGYLPDLHTIFLPIWMMNPGIINSSSSVQNGNQIRPKFLVNSKLISPIFSVNSNLSFAPVESRPT